MPSIETHRKQAKLLVRWHRERNYSIGEKVRLLGRYRHLTDAEVLAMAMPLTLAQEIVAVEAGFRDWAALKAATGLGQAADVEAGAPTRLALFPSCSSATLLPRRPSTRRSWASGLTSSTENPLSTVQCHAITRVSTSGSSIRPTSPSSPRARAR